MDPKTGALIVPLGGVVRFDPKTGPIRDIVNRNEDVLDVRPDPTTSNRLILTGQRAGASRMTLIVRRPHRARLVYDVVVQPDYELLRNVIRRTVPTATVDVIPGRRERRSS